MERFEVLRYIYHLVCAAPVMMGNTSQLEGRTLVCTLSLGMGGTVYHRAQLGKDDRCTDLDVRSNLDVFREATSRCTTKLSRRTDSTQYMRPHCQRTAVCRNPGLKHLKVGGTTIAFPVAIASGFLALRPAPFVAILVIVGSILRHGLA